MSIISTHASIVTDVRILQETVEDHDEIEDDTENTINSNPSVNTQEHNFSLQQSCILYVLFVFGFASAIGKTKGC